MRIFTKDDKELIALVQEQTLSFSEACIALKLDPSTDLIGCDFSRVDFSNSNLAGFNFTNADLSHSFGEKITGIEKAVFDGANIRHSVFDTKEFLLPDNFYRIFNSTEKHFSSRLSYMFKTIYKMELNTVDNIELVETIIKSFYNEPLILCSALSLIDSKWSGSPKRFELIDKVIDHEFPAVCIEALKAIEKCATLKEISSRYRRKIFGIDWLSVRFACFASFKEEEMSAEFIAGSPQSNQDWLDPVEKIQQGIPSQIGPFIYSQKVFEQGEMPSQNGFLSNEGGQFFTRIARKSNLLYRFDNEITGISTKKYYNRLNHHPTQDFYKRLFYMPQCFNILNLASPKIHTVNQSVSDFLKGNTFIISSDSNMQYDLFDYLQSD